jgi:hypothetical protein
MDKRAINEVNQASWTHKNKSKPNGDELESIDVHMLLCYANKDQ